MNVDLLAEWFFALLPNLYFLLVLVVLDLLGGVIVALINKSFNLEKVADFVTEAAGLIFGYLAFELLFFLPTFFGLNIPEFMDLLATYSPKAAYLGIVLKYVGSILGHLASLGIPKLPELVKYIGVTPTNVKYNG